ncbi:DUF885 domain-containing protein [Adhaeribacter pallidiroseus]|uniref:Prolyl oligopeptidase n=1 Tax=Adhaeribacter pallidiroseus TaxID=2072847 RepID=A0A369QL17_9BACT|nr:DUF885 domain-containing protein [Adhaeribacter pallidiroseus]RDC63916.1 hypothetical protein AHMF7616_02525 [Adhaeribacter pallidiroseus]
MMLGGIRLFLVLLITVLLVACDRQKVKESGDVMTSDQQFDDLKPVLLEKIWRLNPEWATSVGYHKYDNQLVIPTPERLTDEVNSYRSMLHDLHVLKQTTLSLNNQTDYRMLEDFFNGRIWYLTVLKTAEWNPAEYNIGSGVAEILNGRYDSLTNRLRSISLKIEQVVPYYEAAKNNIKKPTLEHTQLAILQNKGALTVINDLADSVKKAPLKPFEKDFLNFRIAAAKNEINSYITFLQEEQLPVLRKGKARSFRIGKELFTQKFKHDIQSGYTAEQVYQKALKHKEELHQQMLALTQKLWPVYFPEKPLLTGLPGVKQLLGKLAEEHVPRDSFLTAIRAQIPQLVAFVNSKKLLTQDASKPLVVRPTPEYMRGVAGASVSAPGPYDQTANTYYNVTPLTKYSTAEAESYLREYNKYQLQILNIHEAIPGHYTQLIYSNKSPSLVKAILGNGAMVEGWAVYAERMMLEQGYGNNAPEMWLTWYKWNLRVTLNAILDYSVHVLGMKEKEAIALLTQEGFQEETEAREKWKRATLSQVQLSSYFTGYTEIYDLREEFRKKQGQKFQLRPFHEKFLSFGSAPVRYIRALMLQP